jgi:hypothetical protein
VAEVVEVRSDSAIIDVISSKSIVNVTEAIMDAVPKGRSFLGMVALAPGARFEPLQSLARSAPGFQIDGASSAENTFAIGGQNTTHIQTGQAAFEPPTDFFQVVTVKSSGFEAEHGGALGGVINAVTKRGGSAWHGSGLLYYRNDVLDANEFGVARKDPQASFDAANRLSEPLEVYDRIKDDIRIIEPGFELGGPLGTDRLELFISYIPHLETNTRTVQVPGAGATAFERSENTHHAVGRLDFRATDTLQTGASWNYAYTRTRGIDRPDADGLDGEFNSGAATPRRADRGRTLPNTTWGLYADWTPLPTVVVSARFGDWTSDRQDRGTPSGTRHFFDTSSIGVVSLGGIPVDSTFEQGATFANIGDNTAIVFDDFERRSFSNDLSYFFNALGGHNLKGGWAWNELSNNLQESDVTSLVRITWGDTFTPSTTTGVTNCAAIDIANGGNGCRGEFGYWFIQDFQRRGQAGSTNWAFYLQDSWKVGGGVTLNLGVRFDKEFLPSYAQGPGIVAKPIAFAFGDKVAPRLGAAWDVLGTGKLKLFGSWGWFYDIMKFEMPRGLFGGDYWHNCTFTLESDDYTQIIPTLTNGFACNSGATGALPGTFIEEQDFRIPANIEADIDELIDPNLKPMRQYEFTLGSEFALTSDIGIELRYNRKRLKRTIEDVGIRTPLGEQFTMSNPGEGVSFAPLRDDCVGCPGEDTSDLPPMPLPVREYDGVEIRFNKRLTNNWYSLVSYTWSRLHGNYSGLTSTDEGGRSSPNVNRFFDEQPMLFDANGEATFGPLPTDRPHTFKFFGGYQLNYLGMSTMLSASQVWFSGSPISYAQDFTFAAPTFPFGRANWADLSRDPATGDVILDGIRNGARLSQFTQTNLNIRHEFKLSQSNEALRFAVELNLLNLFNQRNIIRLQNRIEQSIFSFVQFNSTQSKSGINYPAYFAGYDPIAAYNAAGLTLNSTYGEATEFRLATPFQIPRTVRIKLAIVF